jgi:glycosyltransferase involved in cell wall biosynthesis
VLIRLLGTGRCGVVDESGRTLSIGATTLLRLVKRFFGDLMGKAGMLRKVGAEVDELMALEAAPSRPLERSAPGVYLRADSEPGLAAGGSVAHTAGVVNHLGRFLGRDPIFVATARIATVRDDLETHIVPPSGRFRDFAELSRLQRNDDLWSFVEAVLRDRPIGFVYQRYSLDSYVGLKLARERSVPFVLEYNGSEIWVGAQWTGQGSREGSLSERIELLNLRAADLVVTVSNVLGEEVIRRGVAANRVLVNPNGVDVRRYSPDVDGIGVSRRHGLHDKIVIGFIGTFGVWHGAEILAEAFARLLSETPSYRHSVRLLLIGDGPRRPFVERSLRQCGVIDACVLTGTIPQQQGPEHLAACDILVAPHVPNPDGTRFFGSPVKLFEYMATGRGIVASALEQIAEVIDHGRNGWLVEPGNPALLAEALRTLVADAALRDRLGEAARADVVESYTWDAHTRRIAETLQRIARCPR